MTAYKGPYYGATGATGPTGYTGAPGMGGWSSPTLNPWKPVPRWHWRRWLLKQTWRRTYHYSHGGPWSTYCTDLDMATDLLAKLK